jgi:HEAT repeat protein
MGKYVRNRVPLLEPGWIFFLAAVLITGSLHGCAVRTLPPMRYIPLLGAEKKVRTEDVLNRALRDRDPAVRAQAVALLGDLSQSRDRKTRRAITRVLGSAVQDADPGVRVLALEKLGALEPELGNKYLLQALRDPNPFVRDKVLQVIEEREIRAGQQRQQQALTAAQEPAAQ